MRIVFKNRGDIDFIIICVWILSCYLVGWIFDFFFKVVYENIDRLHKTNTVYMLYNRFMFIQKGIVLLCNNIESKNGILSTNI